MVSREKTASEYRYTNINHHTGIIFHYTIGNPGQSKEVNYIMSTGLTLKRF